MPLPIGHALAGIAMQQARPGFFFTNRWLDAFFFMFLANLPDGDFLPGMILGRPNLYHHGIFHSPGAALAVALIGAGLFSLWKRRFSATAAMIFLVFYCHLLLDFFARDLRAPYGLPLLWPFSNRYFIAARPIFINITRSQQSHDFLASLFNRHNLGAALLEALILGGLASAAVLLRYRAEKKLSAQR